MASDTSIFLDMPWHSTISENGWEAEIWAGDSSAHIATISISEKSKEDVQQIAEQIVTQHNRSIASPLLSGLPALINHAELAVQSLPQSDERNYARKKLLAVRKSIEASLAWPEAQQEPKQ